MDAKGQMASASSSAPSAPPNPAPSAPPSAPPSYEEAVGLAPRQPSHQGMPITVAPTMSSNSMPPTQVTMPHQMQPNQTQQTTTEVRIIHQAAPPSLGPNPIKMSCPSCRADIKTTTMSDHQPSAHVCCIVLCLLGCCLCSCLPYCLSAFLSVHHFCPNCRAYLGTWKG
ncbi:hypothetical protein QAD02_024339 [Eretmocerus hayati]|uniref:Uncharacterized protein n=1 Tax=Eretmocerus hayati TaxID=131215 RepID=A0ACC2PZ43_9HYME|nr:hypothetical protein QAD02_024339 [Eretmocerus hayati]